MRHHGSRSIRRVILKACVPNLAAMQLLEATSSSSLHNGVYFTLDPNGIWQPTYGNLSDIGVPAGAPVWQTRKGRPGWYEVDEGWIRIPKGEGKGASKHDAQRRECYKCGDLFHWRTMKMRSTIVYTSDAARSNAGTLAERDDIECGRQYTRKWHTCLACWASELHLSENEAKKLLIENRSQKSVERSLAYQHAKSHIQSTFEFLGYELEGEDLSQAEETCRLSDSPAGFALATTKKPRVADPNSNRSKKKAAKMHIRMKITTLEQIFSPAIDLLRIKDGDEKKAIEHTMRLRQWLAGDTSNFEEGLELEEALEEASYSTRAFSNFDNPGAMQRAADYSDRWFTSEEGIFNAYYICRAGGCQPCNTVIQAQAWDRFKEDPAASGQRWYCHCHAKYKTSWGVLIEIFRDDVACYCLANLPPESMFDVKGMLIQEKFKHVKNARELYDAIPRISPLAKNAFDPIPGRPGMWKLLAMKDLDERPKFDWNQLYNLEKTKAPMVEDSRMQVESLETRTM